MRLLVAFSTLVLLSASARIARADDFSITGNGQSISFTLPASPTPDSYQTGVGFLFNNVSVDFNNTMLTTDVGFGNASIGFPDLFVGNNENVSAPREIDGGIPSYGYFLGEMLYKGTEASPTFLTGSFSITNFENPSSGGTPVGTYDLEISNGTSVTPEPSSFLLLGTGLAGISGVLRRRVA